MIRRWLDPLIQAQGRWADPLGTFFQRIFGALYRPVPPLKDLLHGTWLGHPLHPMLTDVPIGALIVAFVLDLLGEPSAALWATGIGWLGLVASALAGYADYLDLEGTPKVYGSVHSTSMVLALVAYSVSLADRFGWIAGGPAVAVWLSGIGLVFIFIGGYLGGELVFNLGSQVDRHAWRGGGDRWLDLDVGEIPEAKPTKAKAGAQTLVVVRSGDTLWALHDTCSHQGCSLSGGTLVGGAVIECPCHGSRFRLADGIVQRGPALYPQPRFEVRRADGKVQVKRAG